MRKLAVATLLFGLVLPAQSGSAQIASAPPPDSLCGNTIGGGVAHCHDQFTETISAPSPGGAQTVRIGGPTASASGKTYVAYIRLTTDADGKSCVTTGYVEQGVLPSDQAPDTNQHHTEVLNGSNLTGQYPTCPEQPPAPGQLAPQETRTMVATKAWEQRVPLPNPQPSVAPGRAITGKTAYLETNGQLAYPYTENTVFGPLYIDAHGSYVVAWGDGTITGPHSFEGAPWPDGRITHTYSDIGTYNIVVTEHWTATWSLDGENGVLRSLQTAGTINNFPVEQIQAVITR